MPGIFFDNEGFVFDNGRTAVIAIIPSDKGKPMFSERWRTNMKKKRVLSIVLAAAMITGMAAGCGSDGGSGSGKDAKGKVYYLNFKPEADEYWQELAETYTEETGVPVTVLTAASGEYEKTLKSEMAKTDAPTLFQVNGPVGLASWKDYCYDLSDYNFYICNCSCSIYNGLCSSSICKNL